MYLVEEEEEVMSYFLKFLQPLHLFLNARHLHNFNITIKDVEKTTKCQDYDFYV